MHADKAAHATRNDASRNYAAREGSVITHSIEPPVWRRAGWPECPCHGCTPITVMRHRFARAISEHL